MLQALAVRLLQPLARMVAGCEALQPRLWKYVARIRGHFARVMPPLELETTIEKSIHIRTSLSDHIEAQLFWQGYQEADEGVLRLIKKLLPKDGVFIDIGANIGSFSLVAAHVAPKGEVHSFEPSGHHFSRLSHNVALNGFGNVVLNQKGLHDQPGTATLFLPKSVGEINNSGAASLYHDAAQSSGNQVTEEVSLIRLDDYVRDKAIDRIDMIKIDIEGAEFSALKGAVETLARFRPVVLMELDLDNLRRAGCEPAAIMDFWDDLDYQVGRIDTKGQASPIRSVADLSTHQNLLCQSIKA
jgi:FkbM family methyltransferase